jgi:hypothetical membrane protein
VTAVRLSNNSFSTIDGVATCLQAFLDVSKIQWIDLSFNAIEDIGQVCAPVCALSRAAILNAVLLALALFVCRSCCSFQT